MVNIDENTAALAAQDTEVNRELLWQGYAKFIDNENRSKRLAKLIADLDTGSLDLADPQLMHAAINLRVAATAAGLGKLNWPPLPSDEDLIDTAWVERCVTQARAASETAAANRRRNARLARQLRAAGIGPSGKGVPIWQQKSSRSLDELADQLAATIAQHESVHGEFKREWLDPNNSHYLGGMTNKQVIILANMIASPAERSYAENFEIVMNFVRQRRNNAWQTHGLTNTTSVLE
jgi:hypothetical protein